MLLQHFPVPRLAWGLAATLLLGSLQFVHADKGRGRPGVRDGEGPVRVGPRDGEGPVRVGPRDGEGGVRRGPRDGERPPGAGPREADVPRRVSPEGQQGPVRSPEGQRGNVRSPEGERGGVRSPEMERGPARATERDREGGEAREGQPRNGGEARFLTIPVDAGGRMTSAEGNVMAVEDMRAELRRLASTANGRPIYIQANQGIPTESLQSLVAECQRAGIRNLYFAPARR